MICLQKLPNHRRILFSSRCTFQHKDTTVTTTKLSNIGHLRRECVSDNWPMVSCHSRTALKDLYLVQVTGWHKKKKTHRIRKPADVESQDDDEKSLRDLEQKRKNSHISPKPFINLRCQTLSSETTTEKKIQLYFISLSSGYIEINAETQWTITMIVKLGN